MWKQLKNNKNLLFTLKVLKVIVEQIQGRKMKDGSVIQEFQAVWHVEHRSPLNGPWSPPPSPESTTVSRARSPVNLQVSAPRCEMTTNAL